MSSKFHGNKGSILTRLAVLPDTFKNNSKCTKGRKYKFVKTKRSFDLVKEKRRAYRHAEAPAIQAVCYKKIKY